VVNIRLFSFQSLVWVVCNFSIILYRMNSNLCFSLVRQRYKHLSCCSLVTRYVFVFVVPFLYKNIILQASSDLKPQKYF